MKQRQTIKGSSLMNYYICDTFTNRKKYQKQLSKIELLLANLGIGGKLCRLTVLKNIESLLEEAMEEGAENIVAVGNDQTVSKVANLIMNKKITLGIIPIGEGNLLAPALGINSVEEACRILSARKVKKLDVGQINEQYFLLGLESADDNIVFNLENYNINPLPNNEAVGLYNINISNYNFRSNPGDGIMEAVFAPKEKTFWQKLWHKKEESLPERISVFPIKKMTIKHRKNPVTINIDRQRTVKSPAEVTVLKNQLRVIVGKGIKQKSIAIQC